MGLPGEARLLFWFSVRVILEAWTQDFQQAPCDKLFPPNCAKSHSRSRIWPGNH